MEDKKHYSNKTMTKCVFLNNCSNVTLHFSWNEQCVTYQWQ
jgi:hypothetical protein